MIRPEVSFVVLCVIVLGSSNAAKILSRNCPKTPPSTGKRTKQGTVVLQNGWPTGFQAMMSFNIPEEIHGWEIFLKFSRSVSNFQTWRAEIVTSSATKIILRNKSWNNKLIKGATLELSSILTHKSGSAPLQVCADLVWNSRTAPATNAPVTTAKPPQSTRRPITSSPCASGKYNYNEVLHKSILFYEIERSGKLPSNKRVRWRGDSALGDKGENGEDLTGGWYDAGDHVKFGFPMAFSTTLLTWGLIEYKDAYTAAGELQTMLNSIKWPLDYFIKAHVKPNVLYGQVGNGNSDHSFWGRPEDMTMDRPAFKIDRSKPGSDLAAETAAAMAAGSIAFRRSNPTYANVLIKHAKELYQFAEQFRGRYSDSISEARNFYLSSGYNDELVWGAAWLYKATQDNRYLQKAEQYFKQFRLENAGWSFSWDEKIAGAQLLLYDLTRKNIYKSAIGRSLDAWLPGGSVPYTPKGLAWRIKWGATRYAANTAFLALLAADKGLKSSTYRNFGVKQIHYMLGDAGRSYVVGFGNNPPKRPHHRSSSCQNKPAPCTWNDFNNPGPNPQILYGALVGGPDQQDNYQDNRADYIKNEVACDYNAGFQSAVAALKSKELKSC